MLLLDWARIDLCYIVGVIVTLRSIFPYLFLKVVVSALVRVRRVLFAVGSLVLHLRRGDLWSIGCRVLIIPGLVFRLLNHNEHCGVVL